MSVPHDTSSVSPPSQSQQHQQQQLATGPASLKYKRNYRACLNCRLRKVKCDLGPVDSPHDGKCARCLRERKDCVFVESKRGGAANVISGKRKKQKMIDGGVNSASPEENNSGYFESKLPGVKSILHHEGRGESEGVVLFGGTYSEGTQLPPISSRRHDHGSSTPTNNRGNDKRLTGEFSTMESALVFLANAAGEIAKADERDNIDAQLRYDQIEAAVSNSHRNSLDANNNHGGDQFQASVGSSTATASQNNTPISRSSSASNVEQQQQQQQQSGSDTQSLEVRSTIPPYMKPSAKKRMIVPPAESGHAVRPKGSNKLSNIDYIGNKPTAILTEDEATRLINLFFSTMHPFFPHIPKFLHSPTVLANYPILLCAILTISSRYHPFENDVAATSGGSATGSVPRNIEVHDRLWLYVQRLISQTVWAEASTRSIGTVFAFLLFTEWNPRAIHWRWSDYANKAEDNDSGSSAPPSRGNHSAAAVAAASTASTAQTSMNAFGGELGEGGSSGLAGVGAMRRSHRMAWMLIGSAVRLAQDMGFMEISPKTFLATHIAEINSVMSISRRSMLANSLSEVDLDEDDITVEDMEQLEVKDDDDYKMLQMNEEQIKRFSMEHVLKFTKSQKATIELLQIMSLGHESLYGYKAQLGQLSQKQTLSVLNILSPLINNWGKKYKEFLVPTSHNGRLAKLTPTLPQYWLKPDCKVVQEIQETIERETFIIEYNYVKLYIYSLALNSASNSNIKESKKIKLDELSKSAKYIEQAFTAANETLNAAHRIHRFKMLRFMPVRLLTRFIRAAAFIVRCHLTMTAQENISLNVSRITIDEIIRSTHRAAMTLRECSPDELHLLSRYSTILMVLYSEMKAKKNKREENTFEEDEDTQQHQPLVQQQVQQTVHQQLFQSANLDNQDARGSVGAGESQQLPEFPPVSDDPLTSDQQLIPEDFNFDFNLDDFVGDGFLNIVDLWTYLN
ncbi:Transcriptional activator ARO80 [Candida viswanathii]|uniref:Transcriptional activator ARO80 n=1 Tax=Candida viswanathii TaxID=5486 RepID=A0A367XQJ8_9ASCO|nr:Transcriptional activator ARO80 [Candida viswanathii]